jgi:hypothetical protein
MDDGYTIIACQGPPRCSLTGDEAQAAQIAGCPWCERIYGDGSGREEVVKPGEA